MLKKILIIFGYILSTAAIIVITAALVAYGNDYTYDFSTHKIIQKGHVIIDSVPSGVQVQEDGKLLKKKTPYQAAVKVGDHSYKLVKDGFWPWEKVLHVVAGRVALAAYVIFVPKDIPQTTLDSHAQIVTEAISNDHRHMVYITAGPDAAVYTFDIGNKKPVKLYTPKAATPTTPAETLRDVSWSDDASHVLISSDLGGTPEYRLATAGSTSEPVDLTQMFGFNLSGLKFSGSNWKQLYWLSTDGLRRLDLDTNTVSSVLADKVKQFWIEPDRVLYVQQTETGQGLWSLDNRGKKQNVIPALVESDSYAVAATRYSGEDELAVVPLKTGIATLYSGVYGDTPVAKVIAKGITGASFSPDSHLLALSGPTDIMMYDLERSALDNTMVTYDVKDTRPLAALSWFDSYHILSLRAGALYWSEFDGANVVNLGSVPGNLPGYSTPDGKGVLMFKSAANTTDLTQLQIRQ